MADVQEIALEERADDDALARAAEHDPAAFAELYHRHLDRVYRFALARLGDVHQAQDLTAQTFLAALEGIAGYRGQGAFAAWLLTIARHKLADHFRRSQATLPLEVAIQVVAPGPPPEQLVVARLDEAVRVAESLH